MRVLLNGSLASNPAFVSEELPAWVRQVTLSAIWGAQTLSKLLKADRLQQWEVSEDSLNSTRECATYKPEPKDHR
jgi:hypothetical protein